MYMQGQKEYKMTSTLHVIDGTGDTKLIWSQDNSDEIAAARKLFDELIAKKFAAFDVKKKGGMGEQVFIFDPKAEKIIMTPPLAGG